MKKLLFLLISIPLIFSSCEKEEDENQSHNNNQSFTIEQTEWEVSYITLENSSTPGLYLINIPCGEDVYDGGISNIKWTFFNNNGMLIQEFSDGGSTSGSINTYYDTLSYSYVPNLNMFSFSSNGFSHDDITFDVDDNSYTIIELTNNNLTVEGEGLDNGNVLKHTIYLTKIN